VWEEIERFFGSLESRSEKVETEREQEASWQS
jgi:hypothetical protein